MARTLRVVMRGCLLVVASAVVAWAVEIPPALQATMVLKSLVYDRNVEARAKGTVNVAVIFNKDNPASAAAANDMEAAFGALRDKTIKGMSLDVLKVPFDAGTARLVAERGVDVLWVCPGMGDQIAAIRQLAQTYKALTACGQTEYVEQGLVMGVVLSGSRPQFVINAKAAAECGVDFVSDLLGMARVLR